MKRAFLHCADAKSLLQEHLPLVIYDVETTGRSFKKGDRIIQFAGIVLQYIDKKYRLTDQLEVYIKQPIPLPSFIVDLTGITDEQLSDKPDEKEAYVAIKQFLARKAIFVGYNVKFDNGFIDDLLYRQEGIHYQPKRIIDPYILAKELISPDDAGGHLKLESVAKYYGVTEEGFHNAMVDVMNTKKVLFAEMRDFVLQSEDQSSGVSKAFDIVALNRWTKSYTLDRIYITISVEGQKKRIYYDLYRNEFNTVEEESIDTNTLMNQMNQIVQANGYESCKRFVGSWKK